MRNEVSELVQSYLLREFDFVLDRHNSGWRRQYMHRSGIVVLTCVKMGLLWFSNRNMNSVKHRNLSVQLYRRLREFASVISEMSELVTDIATGVVDLYPHDELELHLGF